MLAIKAGDQIRYTSAAGTRVATVRSITIGPTAKPNHSIAWLNLTVFGGKFPSDVSVPADAGSLQAFKVQVLQENNTETA
jgi:hypothetical protein